MLGLDTWCDEPAYQAAKDTFTTRGTFILAKLQAHDAAKLKDVLAHPPPPPRPAAVVDSRAAKGREPVGIEAAVHHVLGGQAAA